MADNKPNIANKCFVCGPDNSSGLKLIFWLDGDICRSEYIPDADHIGYDNLVHGGLIYSALDDVMANWLFLRNRFAVTAKCEIRYRAPAKPGEKILLESSHISTKRLIVILQARATRAADKKLIAEATGTFMLSTKK
ncbi:MAG: hotdog fold domain-containing protein [Pseudomonadota bacterium]|nr:hotdog fold domain-containing protein [Pseudomonadota bacterium]